MLFCICSIVKTQKYAQEIVITLPVQFLHYHSIYPIVFNLVNQLAVYSTRLPIRHYVQCATTYNDTETTRGDRTKKTRFISNTPLQKLRS